MPSLVPLYEEMESMRFANYNEREWRELESEEKAFAVAHYRIHGAVEMHKSDAVAEKMRQESEKAHGT